jgi:hypothetical protein
LDSVVRALIVLAVLGAPTPALLIAYGASPRTTAVGYAPVQPIPYSHKVHVAELGLDCRYCHTSVETTAKANIPPTQTCMNCHTKVLSESPKLEPLRQSAKTGLPVEWVRVHDLPDYVYFDHSAHVTRGVGCVECHGRVDTMDVVYQVKTLSMAWCLDCHRHPDSHLRPPEHVANMKWTPPDGQDPFDFGRAYRKTNSINPRTDCSTCHR